MRLEQGRAILGEVVPERFLPLQFLPSVHDIVSADRATFYGGDADRTLTYYSGASALTHFFRNGPDVQRGRFQAYINAMNLGARSSEAWARTIGAEPPEVLEREFRRYVVGVSEWDLMQAPLARAKEPVLEGFRALSDEETHLLWVSLLPVGSAASRLVQSELAEAARQDVGSAELAYVRGCVMLSQNRPAEALLLFRQAVARAPDEPRYLYGSVMARWRVGGAAALNDLQLREDARRLAGLALSADQHLLVARVLSERGGQMEAMIHVERALQLDPNYYLALSAKATIHFALGQFEDAVADQERAITFAPDEVVDPSLLGALATYRRAQATRGAPQWRTYGRVLPGER
jgi:tetratricopeptide (TPR) repeat protein